MQVQKVDIRKTILHVSRQEFLELGYKNASMRTIAKNAGVGLSNIYNYFKNKDEIFVEVLTPLIHAFDKLLDEHNSPDSISIEIFTSEEYMREQIDMFVRLILKFQKEIELLFFRAHGSTLEDFKEDYTDRHTQLGFEYMRLMKKKYPEINANVSKFFIHTQSSWWMAIISELVSHNLTEIEIEAFVTEYMAFGTGGWRSVMKI